MPRIHQYDDRYAVEDFQREIRCRQGYYDLMTIQAVADVVGIPRSTLHTKLRDPETLGVEDLRKLIPVLHPDPRAVLALLGYTKKEINQFCKGESNNARNDE